MSQWKDILEPGAVACGLTLRDDLVEDAVIVSDGKEEKFRVNLSEMERGGEYRSAVRALFRKHSTRKGEHGSEI